MSGLRELNRAFRKANKEAAKGMRKALLRSAEPVAREAARIAPSLRRNLGAGDPWSEFRIGGGARLVYVAPKQRGRKSRGDRKRRRPNLAPALLEAETTGLERRRHDVIRNMEDLLDDIARAWESG